MKPITLVFANADAAADVQTYLTHPLVERILWLRTENSPAAPMGAEEITVDTLFSSDALDQLLAACASPYLMIVLPGGRVTLGANALERFVQVAEATQAGWLYSDFRDANEQGISDHPVNDYQLGSIRDTFEFGQVVLLDRAAAQVSGLEYGTTEGLRWGALYDLRLKLSIDFEVRRVPETLYTRAPLDTRTTGERLFDYVDPCQRAYQIEMEAIVTEHLKRIDVFLEPNFADVSAPMNEFPVLASVIIPVRNRVKTIADAIKSVLSQQTDFAHNIIVIDNHSTDGTTELLQQLAAESAGKLIHLIPTRTDYGIGGCWNEGIYSTHCGRYAVQLDSDDIYSGTTTLQRIVDELRKGYAMVVGSYTIVDFDLYELPPGLIDHREWTRDNGRNNALRINGLGAPRAFDVSVLRSIGFPNTSYGEDYAVALRLSRDYDIGRIYDSLYYARRWSGNSDSALPLATANRYDAYKDWLRTVEMQARQSLNAARALGESE